MNILAIEASTKTGSCAVFGNEGLLGELTLNTDATHSEKLMPAIISLMGSLQLAFKDLNGVAVSVGPGSFTALRIAISTAKGIAFSANIPLIGVPTLMALAEKVADFDSVICPFLDARKKEVYFALYKRDKDGNLLQLKEETVGSVEEMCRNIKTKTVFLGNGIEVYGERVRQILKKKAVFVSQAQSLPTASTVAGIGYRKLINDDYPKDLSSVRPIYLRPSDAELTLKRKH
ncbi:MAG: tRNA (adenosine(37)-N6)-threonylcarbamoyltransferase complex dimerization subunit type 1 TsaB [Candidatus Schekmanbacteria bacterium RIFCSPHIGHO2_02_FULL_38_11]|uniref:tRNA (Adenosine(37)-N6)-threonylcarbamoyltransferase complex dimerization subunit type 1 TsaB n=1 Tax=Candidatus Schekmanbacteria bacterium RIFCSPLOWO2_12_FULL_38_15 TaxID=1817883 RepID=A0A1F7SJW7_9BACT|nr:MAG: tRNA (adenosine(37)-N6)-threonylcarbamoyltransferase complex dimerization subunit type 1 TsaB [Candidatus Schekmanbacteria bacterium GWA2_38_9]OGL51738.1 MAG: tRNA (adenosine(37)-N6)-threonylcarbamoyltransferase complex dimerization subunit type 1 TsaB [Candidatus Schekmanbacteria bacterium RIFCSPLOWO2_02_FULL_38_14]OGL52405.1 MAG: tRNA (adenosine(37)-N6)-threonylcarbamoyltransferase complex dimerization subunit type 1 TsaB [Candidatus Schekmanbacteria bacterium RIFCSPHIGHO2_02_FULL_38_11